MKEKLPAYGQVTFADIARAIPTSLDITAFVKTTSFKDRKVTILKLEDDTYILRVENLNEVRRAKSAEMRLSQDSLYAILSTCLFFLSGLKVDFNAEIKRMLDETGELELKYTSSPNVNITKEKTEVKF